MERHLDAVVDIMAVPASGDPTVAILPIGPVRDPTEVACDVLVVGGGTGGVAAALAAAQGGKQVWLIEEPTGSAAS
ncbi:MAG: FAD-dependent oxidoreductase [Pseudomonadota bacterium]